MYGSLDGCVQRPEPEEESTLMVNFGRTKRRMVRATLGLVAVAFAGAFSLAVPTMASAATVTSSTHSALTVRARPAAASISGTNRKSAAPNVADGQLAYTPRLALPGCRSEDGFNGNVAWYSSFTLASPWIEAWGEVWDECGTTAHVYLSWYSPTYHNVAIGAASAYTTNGVNYPKDYLIGNPGTIRVTVCANWQGEWRCGQPEPGF